MLVCYGNGGIKREHKHIFNNEITMKRVRHVISFTLNEGSKGKNEIHSTRKAGKKKKSQQAERKNS